MILFRRVPPAGAPAEVKWSRLALWCSSLLLPLLAAALLAVLYAVNDRLAELGLVMMKIDTFAFGGGFASLPLMLREIVDARGWMPASTFMDGIALGLVTPGPIVITATFVGYAVAGLAGALTATVCVFLPSLIVLVLVEPWFRWLQTSALFRAAVRGVLLSLVGLLVSVTIRFALVAPWSMPSGILAAAALGALLLGVEVVWVVLAGAVLSAIIL
jgi:chromate transporter